MRKPSPCFQLSYLVLLFVIAADGFVGFLGSQNRLGWCATYPFNQPSIRYQQVLPSTSKDNEVVFPFSRPSDDDEGSEEEIVGTGDVTIPSTGISVSDEMEEAEKDRFVTEVVPIKGLRGVAQLVTSPVVRDSYEPVRYLVDLSSPTDTKKEDNADEVMIESTTVSGRPFVIVDVPPYSPQLVTRMRSFVGANSRLVAILITNRDAIHYDEAPGVFSVRKAELAFWKQAIPDLAVVAYRLDIPRDCRDYVTQVLDGYGPFALDQELFDENDRKINFVETGRPLTYAEWDHDVAQDILSGQRPPDDEETEDPGSAAEYSPEAIRAKEEGKQILAVFTPGHSFGSTTYIFPSLGMCFAGYTIPVEDTRDEENFGAGGTGPALDCRGYITTNKAGITCQMESARALVSTYVDRFEVVLPARGDPLFLDSSSTEDRKRVLMGILKQYQKIGEIYEQLGITMSSNDDDEEEEE